tara:strand:+ start:2569 stop:2787 length:219 start_codon:yes stop_codon:yes gene_type:complete
MASHFLFMKNKIQQDLEAIDALIQIKRDESYMHSLRIEYHSDERAMCQKEIRKLKKAARNIKKYESHEAQIV